MSNLQLTKRERERSDYEKRGLSRQEAETKHMFIGGWENFDMDYFLRRNKKK